MEPVALLQHVVERGTALSLQDARKLMASLLQGKFSEAEMSDLLSVLHKRGALRDASTRLPLTDDERDTLVDTCGMGGDGSGTFNISTAVALVACAAGAKIAKHGDCAVTSGCGSADVLEALGVCTEHTPESAAESIRQHCFAFLLATRMHPGMKIVAPVRRALPHRTVFNLLEPMANPAGARRQVIGVYSAQVVPLVAEALALGGRMTHALVVHGAGGLDELSLSGETDVSEVQDFEVQSTTLQPENASFQRSVAALKGGNVEDNAAIPRNIFAGEAGPHRDIVVFNAAAVLLVSSFCKSLQAGAVLAARAIDEGKVTDLLQRLAQPQP